MGFDSILQNLWEVLPLSFVLDWFVDVGAALERAQASIIASNRDRDEVEVARPWSSTKIMRVVSSVQYMSNSPDIWQHGWPGFPDPVVREKQISAVSSIYKREDSFPPGYNSPEILQGMSLTHLADGLLILRQFAK